MNNSKLTSVSVDVDQYKKLKLRLIESDLTFNKVVEATLILYNEDESFRQLINNKIIYG